MTEKRERIKMTFEVPEHTRRALSSWAGTEGFASIGEAIEHLVDTHLPEEVSRAKEAIARGDKPGRRSK